MKVENVLSPPSYGNNDPTAANLLSSSSAYHHQLSGVDPSAVYLQSSPPPYPGSGCEAAGSGDITTPMEEDEGENSHSFLYSSYPHISFSHSLYLSIYISGSSSF